MQMLLLRELEKGETFASLLNIHGGGNCVVLTHLFGLFVFLMDTSIWVGYIQIILFYLKKKFKEKRTVDSHCLEFS